MKISTDACILIDADTGAVIYEKNADKILYPASITKIMTAILAIENGDFDKPYIVSQNAIRKVGSGASLVGLKPQEEVYLDDLLYMMLLPSGNDAANAIAENVAGSIDDFVKLMNEKAKKLGAINTTFKNPVGLDRGDGYPEHKTTARDFALITRYAMSLDKYRQVVNTPEYKLPVTNKNTKGRTIKNTNRFFTSIDYDKSLYQVNGGKTGRTMAASNTLVVTAKNNDNIELICVLLKNTDRSRIFTEAKELFDHTFSLIKNSKIEICSGFYDIRFNESKDIINSFCSLGYITGYDDNSFRPLMKASKEEFISILMRIDNEGFERSKGYWSKPFIDRGIERKLIDPSWYDDRRAPIKRGEIIDILYKSIEQNFAPEHICKLMEPSEVRYIYEGELSNLEEVTREDMVLLLNEYYNLKTKLYDELSLEVA